MAGGDVVADAASGDVMRIVAMRTLQKFDRRDGFTLGSAHSEGKTLKAVPDRRWCLGPSEWRHRLGAEALGRFFVGAADRGWSGRGEAQAGTGEEGCGESRIA